MADRLSLSAKTLRFVDIAILLWTIAWVAVAFQVASEVRGLGQLSVTVVAAGVAAEEMGNAVGALDDVPFLGEDLGRVSDRARQAGQSAQQSGAASRESVDDLSWLLGLVVGLVPTLPLLVAWIPLRIRRIRDVRAIRHALESRGGEAGFRAFLARRALERLPYAQLLAASSAPWSELTPDEEERLAAAELRRLGLKRS